MKRHLIFVILLTMGMSTANAQDLLKGTIYETATNETLSNVFIHDNTNRELALADKDGKFEIKSGVGHLLIFDSPGYISDTLYVVDMNPKKIVLKPMGLTLREVTISSSRAAFNPRAEYPEVYKKSKIYVFSPSTWFSKEGKNARRLKRFFAMEARERHVDEVFTAAYVGSIVPLKGQDLEDFMTLYRPTYTFLIDNNGPSLAAYINDSYKKFMALPPDKRKQERLISQ